jgi:membrane-associated protease RseP (regulator of RpoE activity)
MSDPADSSGRAEPYRGPIEVLGPEEPIRAEFADRRPPGIQIPVLPVILFLATCYTTSSVGGFTYSAALMLILTCHEFGHYLQAKRYHVPASLPYFIPIPAGYSPFGTMGAVIAMRGGSWNRKELFDIGISGPLAGLVPALICSIVGLHYSEVVPLPPPGSGRMLGEPLIFQAIAYFTFGPLPADKTINMGALAYAGWVGIFITALNLMPVSQLDGGHVIYALLRQKARMVTSTLLAAAVLGMLWTQSYQWLPMLALIMLIGPNHPPTADDHVPLGTTRIILGWLALAFVIVGFTPTPFQF